MSNISYNAAAARAHSERALAASRARRAIRRAQDAQFNETLDDGLDALAAFVSRYTFEMSLGGFAGVVVYAILFFGGAV